MISNASVGTPGRQARALPLPSTIARSLPQVAQVRRRSALDAAKRGDVLLVAEKLGKVWQEKPLFENLTFSVR